MANVYDLLKKNNSLKDEAELIPPDRDWET